MASIDGVRRTRQSSKQPSESGDIQQPSIIVTRSIDDANNNASIRKRSTRSASRQASVEPQLVASQADEESRPAKRAKHKALPGKLFFHHKMTRRSDEQLIGLESDFNLCALLHPRPDSRPLSPDVERP